MHSYIREFIITVATATVTWTHSIYSKVCTVAQSTAMWARNLELGAPEDIHFLCINYYGLNPSPLKAMGFLPLDCMGAGSDPLWLWANHLWPNSAKIYAYVYL